MLNELDGADAATYGALLQAIALHGRNRGVDVDQELRKANARTRERSHRRERDARWRRMNRKVITMDDILSDRFGTGMAS